MAAVQLRESAAPGTARRWPAPSSDILRLAPLASSRLPVASLDRGAFSGLSASFASSKLLAKIYVKSKCTRTSVDDTIAPEITEDEIPEPTTVVIANEDIDIDQEGSQQKCAKIHDFCLGIPFGGILFSMGIVGYLFWRSPESLTFGIAPGLAILALGVLSLKVWRSGKSSLPFILAQAAVATAVAWKHCQAYTMTRKLLPWGFYAALSATMICFYSYVLLAGGNPPPKKKAVAAL